ncbi:TPA: HAMP domain-containing protein [Providencia rettgeri]|nr:HAMP domain-containing protein [Providencia rettgeri]
MFLYPHHISSRLTIWGGLLLFITTFIIIVTIMWRGQPRIIEVNTALIEETGRNLVTRVSSILSYTSGETASLARLAEFLPKSNDLYQNIPPNLFKQNNLITGVGIWPEPGMFESGVEKKSFYWARNTKGELIFSNEYNVGLESDYHNEDWYKNAREKSVDSCAWSNVYSDTVTGVNMVTCSIPYKIDGQFSGVATTDIHLDSIAAIIRRYGDSTGGYAFVIDRQGQVIYFPNNGTIKAKTIEELISHFEWLEPIESKLGKSPNEQFAIDSISINHDGILKSTSQIMLFPMIDTEWIIGLATPQSRITGLAQVMMQDVLEILLPVLTVLLLSSGFFIRRVIKRLDETRKALNDIAQGEGDLTRRMSIQGNDEISAIAQAFNLFADKISAMLLSVRNSSAIVAGNTTGLADNNHELSARVTQQAAALEQSASAMEELNATVKQNSENANHADGLAEDTAQMATQCSKMMKDVVSTMDTVNSSSKKMVEIVTVIDSIAFQTNILALNAAVEAARAGASGRGFAVVAAEVRVLAQRSAQAANEIKALIDGSVKNIQTGDEQLHHVGDTLTLLVENVVNVRQLMGNIRIAGDEQSKGLAEITVAVSEMDTTVQQNAALIDDTVSRTDVLKEEAEHLADLVSVFKLPNNT